MKTYILPLFFAVSLITSCGGLDACDCVNQAKDIDAKINKLIDEGKESEAKDMESKHNELKEKCEKFSEEDFKNCAK